MTYVANIDQAYAGTPGQQAPPDAATSTTMHVRKRNGGLEAADVMKIVRAVERSSGGLDSVDPLRVATRTISGLYDGATTRELDELSIRTAASLIAEEPEYSKLAGRLLAVFIDKEVRNQDIHSFSQSVKSGHALGLINDNVAEFVIANARKLDDAIRPERDQLFEYFGIRTLYDRYLLKHPSSRDSIETPQHFFLRIACGLAESPADAIDFYDLISSLDYMPSSPTLFNSGTRHSQMSSCYLLDSPQDDLEAIYNRYTDIAKLSKFAGGIGVSFSRVRSQGSLIEGTNGTSNGIVPWLKTLDSSVAAVNQGGKRKGAACVYVESWHADIEDFLELKNNTGDESRRAHNLNLANWVPDLFMKRVEEDGIWSLFDPKMLPEFVDTYGEEFERIYTQAEAEGRFERQISARELYARMMRTLAQTGNGWMTFKDTSNRKSNQTLLPQNVIHLSNLCTEILEVTNKDETAVCNLGSLNLGHFLTDEGVFDYDRLGRAREDRRALPGPSGRHQLLPHRRGGLLQQQVAARRPRRHGPAGRLLQDADAVRQQRSGEPRRAHPGRGLLRRARHVLRARGGAWSARDVQGHARSEWRAPVRFLGRHAQQAGVAGAARAHQALRPAELPAHRHRAHGHHRVHLRRLRVHRAAGLQPVQARDPLR